MSRPPHRVQQLLAREHPARVLQEEFQQPEFGGPEMQRPPVALHAVRVQVHRDVVEGSTPLVGTCRIGPPQQRADARQQRIHANGLVM
jgi:hypothetical protein